MINNQLQKRLKINSIPQSQSTILLSTLRQLLKFLAPLLKRSKRPPRLLKLNRMVVLKKLKITLMAQSLRVTPLFMLKESQRKKQKFTGRKKTKSQIWNISNSSCKAHLHSKTRQQTTLMRKQYNWKTLLNSATMKKSEVKNKHI